MLNISNLQSINKGGPEYSSVAVRTDRSENLAISRKRVSKLHFSHNCIQITSHYSTFSMLVLLLICWVVGFFLNYSKLFVKLSHRSLVNIDLFF